MPIVTASASRRMAEMMAVPRLAVRASAGPGVVPDEEKTYPPMAFDTRWLRDMTGGSPAGLSIIRVSGDSMMPTLSDGDEILVDRGDAADRLRDGIYVLRVDDALMVKRLAISPVDRRITVRSDNRDYPAWENCDPASIEVIGRVVWVGRRVS